VIYKYLRGYSIFSMSIMKKRTSHSNVRHYLDMANALIDELLLPIETDVNIIV